MTDGIISLSNTLSIFLAEKEEHSFLYIELLNSNVSGKSGKRWRENISSAIIALIIFALFEKRDFSSSFINVLLVALLILPSIWHRLSGISVRG